MTMFNTRKPSCLLTSNKSKAFQSNQVKERLDKDFFERFSTIELSKQLLGKLLCRRVDNTVLKGIIVETEAYLGVDDHASYTFGGRRTDTNEPMYMKAGTCFVKFTYGMYHCFNLSSRDEGAAVLIRAVQPVEGIDKMIDLRMDQHKSLKKFKPNQVCNGPSKLCIAFHINKSLNKSDILSDRNIWLEHNEECFERNIVVSTRIGINSKNLGANKPLRYYLKDNKFVSKQ